MGKEFKKQEYIFELKLVQLVSVDNANQLKDKLLKTIEKRIFQYNFDYLENEIDTKGSSKLGAINGYGYYKGRLSKYNDITEEQKHIMNNEIAKVRKTMFIDFTEEQKRIIDKLYAQIQSLIQDLFNNSDLFKEVILDSYLDMKLSEMED